MSVRSPAKSLRTISREKPRSKVAKKFVFFSDELLLLPKVSPGRQIEAIAEPFGYAGLDAHKLTSLYNWSMHKNLRHLYKRELWTEQDFNPSAHFINWRKDRVADVMTGQAALNPTITPAAFDKLCDLVVRKMYSTPMFIFHSSILQLLRAFNERGIGWGVISNSDPYFSTRLMLKNSKLPVPIFDPDQKPPIIIEGTKTGYFKPHYNIFQTALRQSHRLKLSSDFETWFVGGSKSYDYVPHNYNLPMKSIKLTDGMDNPTSDIKTLTKEHISKLNEFRVESIAELFTVFDLPPPEKTVSISKLLKMQESRELQKSSLWQVLNGEANKETQSDEEIVKELSS